MITFPILQQAMYLFSEFIFKKKERKEKKNIIEMKISCDLDLIPGNFGLLSIKLFFHVIHNTKGGNNLEHEGERKK